MINNDFSKFERLVEQRLDLSGFYPRFLEQLVEFTDAHAGIIWDCSINPFKPLAEFSRNGSLTRVNLSDDDHNHLLSNSVENQNSIIVRPADGNPGSLDPCIIICPASVDGKEAVELVVPPPDSPELQEELFSVIKQACAIASTFLPPEKDTPAESATPAGTRPEKGLGAEEMDTYVHALNESIDKSFTCSNVANETRRVLGCDRVSVLLKGHGGYRVKAISGLGSVNRRSNNVQLIERLGRKILQTRSSFWYPESENIAPQISSILDNYLALSATRSLIVEPIFEKPETGIVDPDSLEREGNVVIGGLVIEHCHELWTRESHESVTSQVVRHSGNAIRNAWRHQQLFLYPLWNLLGKSRVLTAPRILPKTILVAVVLLLLIVFLTFWRTEFYVSCDGELVPSNTHLVFSNVVGVVEEVYVDHGTPVQEDDVLLKLSSEDLELKIQRNRGAIESLQNRLEELYDSRIRNPGEPGDGSLNSQSINTLEAELASLRNEFDILNRIVEKMVIRSPMVGTIITWDVRKKLLGRPVSPESTLMEVAEVEGEWELVLHLEDRKIGHLLKYVKNADNERPRVSFILAADASERFEGTIIEISETSELTADRMQAIRIRVEIDSGQLPVLQARTSVKARIICGKTSLGYLWFHEIPEFLNKNVFFYFAK